MNINKILLSLIILSITCIFIFGSVFSYPSSDWIIINSINNNNIFFFYDKYLVDQYPVITNEGRYHILNGLHLNMSLIISNLEIKRIFIGIIQACTYLLFIYILFKNTEIDKNWFSLILFITFIFSQQFLYPFFHPALEESIFSFLIALLLFLVKRDKDKYFIFKLCIVLFLLILAKITSLIIIVGYLLSLIFFKYVKEIKIKNVNIWIFTVFIIFWLYLVHLTNGQVTYEDKNRLLEFYKYLFLYLNTDPLLFLIPLFVLFNKNKINTFHLKKNIEIYNFYIAGLIYLICLVMTGKHSQYHILPVYVCFLPVFFIYLKENFESSKFSFISLIISVIILIIYLLADNYLIIILNIIFLIYLNIYLKKLAINNIKLIFINLILLIILIVFYKRAFLFSQLLYYVIVLMFVINLKNFPRTSRVLSYFLFLFFTASLILPGLLTSYYHFANQKIIIRVATKIHNSSLTNTSKTIIIFDLNDAKPEDVVNHSYILAKTIGSVYGDTIHIMPLQCHKIPEMYDGIRHQQTIVYARDFDKILKPCQIDSLDKTTDYIYVYASRNNFYDIFLSKLNAYNPNQLILSNH
jgi:hypothetical protein